MKELISIIVPVYNAEKTLTRCVEALLGQTYSNIEILLIDDGSKDRSLDICREFARKDPRLKVIYKKNGGVSSARNAGLDTATGTYVMFCDSDDWVESDWCETLLNAYETDSLAMCQYYIENAAKHVKVEEADGIIQRHKRDKFFQLDNNGMFVPWNKIYSKKVIDTHALRFHEKLTNGEDLLFNAEYVDCIAGDIIFVRKKEIHYTWPNQVSLSNVVFEDYFEQLHVLWDKLAPILENLKIEDQRQWLKVYTHFFNEYQKGLLWILRDKNKSFVYKWKIANAVMRSSDYQFFSRRATISPNALYSWVCRRNSCFAFWAWNAILCD